MKASLAWWDGTGSAQYAPSACANPSGHPNLAIGNADEACVQWKKDGKWEDKKCSEDKTIVCEYLDAAPGSPFPFHLLVILISCRLRVSIGD